MKLVEMAFKELTFRIMEFPNTLVLITFFSSSHWPISTSIGQIIFQ